MKVVPIGENVMVKRTEAESVSPGGIVLPDTAKEKPWQGRVLSVSDGRLLPNGERVPHQVAEGDHVLFASYAGTEVVVDGMEFLIMSERDILAVIE
jgi:chaperonin GroES